MRFLAQISAYVSGTVIVFEWRGEIYRAHFESCDTIAALESFYYSFYPAICSQPESEMFPIEVVTITHKDGDAYVSSNHMMFIAYWFREKFAKGRWEDNHFVQDLIDEYNKQMREAA